MNFKELKPVQKQYVIEVMNRLGHKVELITLSDMKRFHKALTEARESGGPKLGYPNWLIVPENKLAKGVYKFPIPTESEYEDYLSGKTERVVDLSKFSHLLKNVIKEYGLKP